MNKFIHRSPENGLTIKYVLWISILLFGGVDQLFSQNKIPSSSYCSTSAADTLFISNPPQKTWTCSQAGVITNLGGGKAIFTPSLVPGPYPKIITILYQAPNYDPLAPAAYDPTKAFYTYSVTISTPVAVSFSSIADVCQNAPAFALDPRGTPAGGIYAGTGVIFVGGTSYYFNPSSAGAGTFSLSYTYPATGCNATAYQTATVKPLPAVAFGAIGPFCVDAAPVTLTTGSPLGGTYSGPGVYGGVFYPDSVGPGKFPITYTYSNGSCTNSVSQNVTVNPLPTITFSGLVATQCNTSPVNNLTANVTGGSYSGSGITNLGGGKATFNPATSGLGYHNIIFSYTDANGCSSSLTQKTRVGTEIFINGLGSSYCSSVPVVNFTYTPVDASKPMNRVTGDGITDNLNGTATFKPALAGVGNHTITYTYVDENACVNIITQTVQVNAVPVADFSGLNASLAYCANAGNVLITGNYAPGGSFSGSLGCIIDKGNGTATFSPSSLPVGGPYSISYTYTDTAVGCSGSITKSVNILDLPTGTISGGSTVCKGDSASIDVNFTGTGPFSFTYNDSISNYNVSSVSNPYVLRAAPSTSRPYTLVSVTQANGCSNTGSGLATVYINPTTAIAKNPANQTVCPGNNITFSVTATGTNLSYQWMKGGADIAGATNNVLIINNVKAADVGSYACKVSGSCGSMVTSGSAQLTVLPVTSILTEPVDMTVCGGEGASFSVNANGVGLKFQWQKNGLNLLDTGSIIGSNSNNLVITGATGSDAAIYTCQVSGTCGDVNTVPVNLSVNQPIAITSQPANQSNCPGNNVSFTVAATGTSPGYQWQFNNSDIAGETNSTLNLTGITALDAGNYRCVISGAGTCSSVASNSASLQVYQPVAITFQPSDYATCEGKSAIFNITASGSNLSYQWKHGAVDLSDGPNISGAKTPNLTLSNLVSADGGSYVCVISGSCGSVTSKTVSLVVDSKVVITAQPDNVTACKNDNIAYSVTASGSNLTYQWYKDGVSLAGETNNNLAINNVDIPNAGGYVCNLTNACGTVASNQAILTINPVTTISIQPIDATNCEGTNASFSVLASGSNLSYQWTHNGSAIIDTGFYKGSTTAILLINGVKSSYAGNYVCQISGNCGDTATKPASLTVNKSVQIAGQPVNLTSCAGSNVNFTVLATGTNLSYQWKKDNTNIPGATSNSLILPAIAQADSGTYQCMVSNMCNSLNSNPVSLNLLYPVNIMVDPKPQTVCQGANAVFSVTANGSNLTYQWRKNGSDMIDTGNISGSNGNNLFISPANLTDGASYSCFISNSCGFDNSASATLSINSQTRITLQPLAFETVENGNASFSISAEGDSLTYQWYKDGTKLLDDTVYSGVSTSVLALTKVKATHAGSYYCKVTGACGSQTSNPGLLTVTSLTVIMVQPLDSLTKCEGESASFSLVAQGTNLTYQWKKDGADLSDDSRISGSKSATLHINSAVSSDGGNYSCLVTGAAGMESSMPARFTVYELTDVTTQPINAEKCEGDNALFVIAAAGNITKYQWQKNKVNLSDDARISGSNTPVLSITNLVVADSGAYSCIVTGTCANDVSNPARLIVHPTTIIISSPVSQTRCEGTSVIFSVTATGSNLLYQWKKNGVALSDGGNISGSQTKDLSISNIVLSDQGTYSCSLSGLCGTDNSSNATLTVNQNIQVISQPVDASACLGSNAKFEIQATGSSLSYQWQKDGVDLAGETASSLFLTSLTAADSGAYMCKMASSCGNKNSFTAALNVLKPVAISVDPKNQQVCEGSNVNISVGVSGSDLHFQWRRNGVDMNDSGNISGSNTSNLYITPTNLSDSAIYSCFISNACNFSNTTAATLTVYPQTQITLQPGVFEAAENGNASFAITAIGNALTYQWYKDSIKLTNDAVYSGVTTSVLNLTKVNSSHAGSYYCKVMGTCGSQVSDPGLLKVNTLALITGQPSGPLQKCAGESASFTVVASGASLSYQWMKDGTNLSDAAHISGSKTATLLIDSVAVSDGGNYSCLVKSTAGNENSLPALLTVYDRTDVITQPVNAEKCEGDNALFVISAVGNITGYQWQKNKVNLSDDARINGSNTSVLSILNLTVADSGAYTCMVTGTCANDVSSPARLTVHPTTVITSSPVSKTRCEGTSTSFNVAATGSGLVYQWTFNGSDLPDTGAYSGSKTPTLQISNIGVKYTGVYLCKVSGNCGILSSAAATLTVNQKVQITSQPSNISSCAGSNQNLTVQATGSGLTYQWNKDGIDIPLATGNTLSLTSVTPADSGLYMCVVSGVCNSVNSYAASLNVLSAPAIVGDPKNIKVCDGANVNFSVTATGSNLNYQWRRNGVDMIDTGNISGSSTGNLFITPANLSDTALYSCYISNTCDFKNSTAGTLTVYPQTQITLQPGIFEAAENGNASFAVAATGSALTYQWYKDSIKLSNDAVYSGVATSILNLANVNSSQAGSYFCEVTGTCGSQISDPGLLKVSILTQITVQPSGPLQKCAGESASFTVVANGSTLSYQWMKNGTNLADAVHIHGSKTATLHIDSAAVSDAGNYSCLVKGTAGNETSLSAQLIVYDLTDVITQPINAAKCEGDDAVFVISATGNITKYQWQKNMVNLVDDGRITGANTPMLNIPNLTVADSGVYYCVVTGTCASDVSNPANLSVHRNVLVTSSPVSQTKCAGESMTFSVVANGDNLVYQWKKNGIAMVDSGNVSGSKTKDLAISNVVTSNQGTYSCMVTGPCGSDNSLNATLTVNPKTLITQQPQNQVKCEGDDAFFSVKASGSGLTYQWRHGGIPLVDDGSHIVGSNAANLTVSHLGSSDKGVYDCYVTGSCGNYVSDPANLDVNANVQILSGPADDSVCSGHTVILSVVSANGNDRYQWQKDGTNIGDTTANLTISNVNTSDAGLYSCIVTGLCNVQSTGAARITVLANTVINISPLDRTINSGDAVSFTVNATGYHLSYQWRKNGIDLTDGGNISGAKSSVLSIGSASVSNAGAYTCLVSGTCDSALTKPANLVVNAKTVILTNPTNQSVCAGGSVVFSVSATGDALTYQWMKDGLPIGDATGKISGALTPNLNISSVSLTDNGLYYCTVTGAGGSMNSAPATLTVSALTSLVSGPPSKLNKCAGENVYFQVTAIGSTLSYAWERNGTFLTDGGNIKGSHSDILTITSVSSTADNGIYICHVYGTCDTLTTGSSTLTVTELPAAAGTITGSVTICQGAEGIGYEVAQIPNATSYEWTLPYGATVVNGNGSRFITINYADNALGGTYSVHGKNACGIGPESAPLNVTVNPIPLANAGFDQTLCSTNATLNANNTTHGTWALIKGSAVLANATAYNSNVSNIGQGTNVFVWNVTDLGCTASDTVVLTNNMLNVNAGTDQTLCSLTTTLHATPVAGTVGNWSVTSGGANFTDYNDPNTSLTNVLRGTNVLKWTINNKNCLSYDEVTITNDLPSNAVAGPDTVLLTNSYVMNANTPVYGTGTWSLVSGSGSIANPASPTTGVTNLGIGENIFRWTITKNSCLSQDEVKVINYTLTKTDAGPDQTLCSDNTVLAGTQPNYGTGQWSVIQGAGIFSDPSKFDTKVTNIGKGVNVYRWTIYEYKVTYDDVTIVNNSPTDANAGVDQQICFDHGQLSANKPLIGTGVWTNIGGSGVVEDINAYNSQVSGLSSGKNTFRWTITHLNCSSSDEVSITNDEPTEAFAGDDQVVCVDSATLYNNIPTVGTGEWSVISGSANFVGNKAYGLNVNANYLKWTITHNGCSSSDTVIITSHKPTTANTVPEISQCIDSLYLPGNAPLYGTGKWTILNGSAVINDPSVPNALATRLVQGLNKFRWTITYDGCYSSADVNVYYNLIPATAGPDQVLCADSAILSGSNPGSGSGLWSIAGGTGSANFDNPANPNTKVTGLDRGKNILRWTITNKGCTSTDEVVIENDNPTTAYAGPDRSICGEAISLSANKPDIGTGTWSVLGGSATFANPNSNTSEVTGLNLGKNTLRWTITNLGCTSYDEVVITNNMPTNIDAGIDQFLCTDSAQLYASLPDGGSGRWTIGTGSATFANSALYNTYVRNLAKGVNTLVWTVTIGGCSNYDTVKVVNNLPSLPSAGPDQDNCASDAFMAANLPQIGTGRWSVVSGSSSFADPADPFTKVTNIGNGVNVLRWTITNGSCSLSDDMNLINSLPTIAYAGEDRSVCNNSANLLANPPTTGTGKWTVVSGFGVIGNPADYNTQITSLGFGPNTVRWTTQNGRCVTSDDVVITNNLAESFAGLDQVVYSPNITLVGNKPSSGTGSWKLVAGQGNIETPGNFETKVTNLGQGANTFYWTIDNNGCIASDDVIITYLVMPSVDFTPSPQDGCPPLTVDFINSSVGGNPFSWDFGDGTTSTKTNPSHIYTAPGKYAVTLTGTGPDGYLITKDTVVIVHELPVADFKAIPSTVYISEPSSNLDQPLHCYTLSQNIDSVLWDFGDGTISKEFNPLHIYQDTGVYDLKLTVTTGYQCSDTKTVPSAVTVKRKGRIVCPNAFTPNLNGPVGGYTSDNDYSNDVFVCYTDDLLGYHLEVYNRLGVLMFKSDDPKVGWDGYFQGHLVEEGVYVYRITGKFNNGEEFTKVGNIVVIYTKK